jgi:phage baseplate assembly protein W
MGTEATYLGTSIAYPLRLVNGKPALVSGRESVRQGITALLDTQVGSRFFLRDYGSRLSELIFEPNDVVLEDMLTFFVGESIKKWEKRVRFIGCSFKTTNEIVNIEVRYEILNSNEIDSFIYDFYRELKY